MWPKLRAGRLWGPLVAKGDRQTSKAPRPTGPLQGCRRCRGCGAIVVVLVRAEKDPQEYAVRCLCAASANYSGLMEVDSYIDRWRQIGATVYEWSIPKEVA